MWMLLVVSDELLGSLHAVGEFDKTLLQIR